MIGRLVTLASSRRGWASLCRLVSAAHADGERGSPRVTRELIGRHGDDLVVMLGPDSDLGRALDARSDDRAETLLREWLDVVPRDRLAIGVTNPRVAGHGQGSASLAGRMLAFADRHGITGVSPTRSAWRPTPPAPTS